MTACSSCGVMDDKHMRTCYFMIREELAAAKAEIEKLKSIDRGFCCNEIKRLREALEYIVFCNKTATIKGLCMACQTLAQSALHVGNYPHTHDCENKWSAGFPCAHGGKREKCMFCAKEAGVCECLKNMRSNRCWCGEGLPCPHGGKEGNA